MYKKNFFFLLLIFSIILSCYLGLSKNQLKFLNGSGDNQISSSPRWGHDMVYDPINQKIILFGGYGNDDVLADTWIYDYQENNWVELAPDNSPPARHSHKMVFVFFTVLLATDHAIPVQMTVFVLLLGINHFQQLILPRLNPPLFNLYSHWIS